ncbi:AAA family ATPase [Methyloceanibacter caenitepidi]|uniref:Putative regulatory prophage protein n=1 Tax=Methyloceanibacter caenitepidi TaxID=1384459 RepID=A0A0A8JZ47_9HYPH|nr:AAA family ATPase [Methyloceanibacter caenitepidi]BAQ16083.1 putative regulatory prophage protein [Methyloceanibacter caenitepidi]
MISFEPAAAPQFILDIVKRRRHAQAKDRNPQADLDTDQAIKRAVDYLKGPAPKAIAFEGGNDTTYKVAARIRDFGISEGAAFDLISEHWNEAGKAEPPWDAQELKDIIDHAYSYATAAWGGMSGTTEFDDVSGILETAKKSKRGLYRVRYPEAAASAFEQIGTPLVEDVLNAGAMGVMYGASGSGKTFLSLDLSFHVAAGLPWHGRPTTQGPVLYVAAEGGRGIFKRIAALKQHFGVDAAPLDVCLARSTCCPAKRT